MKLTFFKTLWGHHGPFAQAAEDARLAGFDGLEGPMPKEPERKAEFLDALKSRNLLFIAEISTTGYAVPDPGSTVPQHLDAFERILVDSLPGEPLFFSAMAGNDLWSFRQSVSFFEQAIGIARRYGVRVGFETHRSRSLFHPIVAKELLTELPELELTVDFSHWCAVCERLVLDELPEVLALCAERVLHIQPRVGYDQGAQVPDPCSPRFAAAVEAHLRWWEVLITNQIARGFPRCTLTPEFGPDGYQQVDPMSGQPYGDLWVFNQYMAEVLRSRFDPVERL